MAAAAEGNVRRCFICAPKRRGEGRGAGEKRRGDFGIRGSPRQSRTSHNTEGSICSSLTRCTILFGGNRTSQSASRDQREAVAHSGNGEAYPARRKAPRTAASAARRKGISVRTEYFALAGSVRGRDPEKKLGMPEKKGRTELHQLLDLEVERRLGEDVVLVDERVAVAALEQFLQLGQELHLMFDWPCEKSSVQPSLRLQAPTTHDTTAGDRLIYSHDRCHSTWRDGVVGEVQEL